MYKNPLAALYFDRKSITEQRWTLNSSNIVENFEAQVATVIIYEKVYLNFCGFSAKGLQTHNFTENEWSHSS